MPNKEFETLLRPSMKSMVRAQYANEFVQHGTTPENIEAMLEFAVTAYYAGVSSDDARVQFDRYMRNDPPPAADLAALDKDLTHEEAKQMGRDALDGVFKEAGATPEAIDAYLEAAMQLHLAGVSGDEAAEVLAPILKLKKPQVQIYKVPDLDPKLRN